MSAQGRANVAWFVRPDAPVRHPWWWHAWMRADEWIGNTRIGLAGRLGRHQGEILYSGLSRWRRYG